MAAERRLHVSLPVDNPMTPTMRSAPERGTVLRPQGWALHTRILAALLVVGALLVGVVAAAVVLQLETRRLQQDVVGDYYNSLRISQNYFIGMLDAETSVRGYALGGDADLLLPLSQSGQPWSHPISAQVLRTLPKETKAVASMRLAEQAALAWYQQWARPTIEQVRRGEPVTTAQVMVGKQLFDGFRTNYNTYIGMLRPNRQAEAQHLHGVTNLLFGAVLACALIAVLGSLALWFLLRRWVSRPVGYLAKEARIVSGGDLGHQVSGLGPPEFVLLSADVEAMRRRLVAQIGAVEEASGEVASARARLEEQTLELQRSNRELEQFAYVASHDLQEPLRKVASFCQMLQRRYAGQLDDRADQYIHFAVDGAKRMQQLINDLLEFSRVGRVSTPRVDVDLMDCLRNALFSLETAREESGAQITWDELPTVHGEAPLLTQLLQNLLGNAIKFHSQEPPRIRLGVVQSGDFWEFSCTDNGIGIEPEYADRVFLIFQRLHPKEVYSGTGIGLAMCKKIVEYHGGRIWVEESPSTPGTTMRWTLPVISTTGVTAETTTETPTGTADPAAVDALPAVGSAS
jgi:signal transduction histidine kinase